jgi:hypothetical protein
MVEAFEERESPRGAGRHAVASGVQDATKTKHGSRSATTVRMADTVGRDGAWPDTSGAGDQGSD